MNGIANATLVKNDVSSGNQAVPSLAFRQLLTAPAWNKILSRFYDINQRD